MEINEVLDGLRLVRNLANGMKIAHGLNSKVEEAELWKQGAEAANEAIELIEQTHNLIEAMSVLLERR